MKLKDMLAKHDECEAEVRGILYDAEGNERDDLTDEEKRQSAELLETLDQWDERIRAEKRSVKRTQRVEEARELVRQVEERATNGGSDARVTNEPMQYGEGSAHSYFNDLVRWCGGPQWGGYDSGVQERMSNYAHQVEREIADDSKFGKRAVNEIRGMENVRNENGLKAKTLVDEARERGRVAREQKELRTGIVTGGGATASAAGGGGAAFVTPAFYVTDYPPFREAGRPFADVVNHQPLPDYGMNIYMPAVQGAAGVGTQTEGNGVTETDPTFGYISAGLNTEAGQVIVTQQLLDRAGPGVQFDRIIFDQLVRDYNPKIDAFVLAAALATAGSISYTGSWAFAAAPGTASFVSKAAGAINAVETTAGTVMSPTHMFLQTSRWNFIESVGALSGDGSLHPLVVPSRNGPFNAISSQQGDGSVPYEGDTGYKILGLPVYKDLNIPAPTTGADQAVICNAQEVWFFEGPRVPRVIPQTFAQNLQVLLQLYAYVAVIVRYPKAVQTVNGTGMAAITF